MSDCRTIQKDLSALIDGELPSDRQAAVNAHVAQCPACAQHVAELRKLGAGLAALPAAEPAPQLLAAVRRKLRADEPTWVDTLFRPVWWKVPLEACAAVLVIAGIYAFVQPAPQPAPVLAQATTPGRAAKILPLESVDRLEADKLADSASALRTAGAVPSAAPVPQPPIPAALPELPETMVIRGDTVVAVRLRAENLARVLDGRVESAVPTNSFVVFLPRSKVAAFRSQVAGVSFAAAAPVGVRTNAEPVVGVKVVVEP